MDKATIVFEKLAAMTRGNASAYKAAPKMTSASSAKPASSRKPKSSSKPKAKPKAKPTASKKSTDPRKQRTAEGDRRYSAAAKKDKNVGSHVSARNKAKKGSREWVSAQNAINKAYGSKKRYAYKEKAVAKTKKEAKKYSGPTPSSPGAKA